MSIPTHETLQLDSERILIDLYLDRLLDPESDKETYDSVITSLAHRPNAIEALTKEADVLKEIAKYLKNSKEYLEIARLLEVAVAAATDLRSKSSK